MQLRSRSRGRAALRVASGAAAAGAGYVANQMYSQAVKSAGKSAQKIVKQNLENVFKAASKRSKSVPAGGKKAVQKSGKFMARGAALGPGTQQSSHKTKLGKKTVKKEMFQTKGSAYVFEGGGVNENKQKTLYLGVGTPGDKLLDSVFRSIISQLIRKSGQRISSWSDLSPNVAQWVLYIRHRETGVVTSFAHNSSTIARWYEIAEDWATVLKSATIAWPSIEYFKATYATRGDATEAYTIESTIFFTECDIVVHEKHQITIQNQTPPDAATSVSSTDVFNSNPLRTKTYYFKGNNIVLSEFTQAGGADYAVNTANPQSGIITKAYTGALFPQSLWKLPLKNAFKYCQSVDKEEHFQPGAYITRTVDRSYELDFNKFMIQMAEIVQAASTNNYVLNTQGIGCCLLVALEKVLDTRVPSELGVSAGYQFTTKVDSYLQMRKMKPTAMIVDEQVA